MSCEAGLIAGLARDVAAGHKEIGNAVDLRMVDDAATGGLDRFDVGSGGSIAKMSNGVRIPRRSGRSG
jgi:hypothetical protein